MKRDRQDEASGRAMAGLRDLGMAHCQTSQNDTIQPHLQAHGNHLHVATACPMRLFGGALSRRARGLRALYRRLSQAAQFPLSANQWRRSHRAAYRRRTAPVVQHNTGALLLASLASCEALRHSWGLAIRSRSHMELAWQITSLQHTSDKPRTIYELQISPQTRSALFCHASQHDFPC